MKYTLLFFVLLLAACRPPWDDPKEAFSQPVQVVPTPALTYPLRGDALKIGINAHPQAPQALLRPFARVRLYEPWRYTYTQLGIATEPSRTGNCNLDTYYQVAKNAGQIVSPCVSWKLDWLANTAQPEWLHAPMNDPGTNPDSPFAYGEWSRYWWQITARYGRFAWNDIYLRVDDTPRWNNDDVLNTKKTGLATLDYVEPENEPNRWWKPPYAQYTPAQAAAMLSAAFDGHMGQMGFGTGIKCADDLMKVVMSGSSTIDTAWLQGIYDWCIANRTGPTFWIMPFDVINLHHYSNAGNDASPKVNLTGPGVCPEADGFKARISGAVAWKNSHVPGAEIWISEFGWDTDAFSPQRCEAHGAFDQETVQAQWIVRAYLEAIAAGVDGAYAYCLANEPGNTGLFGASGLTSSEGTGFVPKKSYYAVLNLIAQLNGFSYAGDFSTDTVRRYKFQSPEGQIKFVVWSPTMDGRTVFLQTPGGLVTVTETPIFIHY